jgi:hypothetical protein
MQDAGAAVKRMGAEPIGKLLIIRRQEAHKQAFCGCALTLDDGGER